MFGLTSFVYFALFLFSQSDCKENNNHREVSLRGLVNQLKARLMDRRGNDDQYEYLNVLDSILGTIENISINTNTAALEEKIEKLAGAVAKISTMIEELSSDFESIGTTYVRWGRTVCPGNGSVTMYSGFAGGSHYTHSGAAASMLCLHNDPDWKSYDDGKQDAAFIYGAEYNDKTRKNKGPNVNNLLEDDVPCVVCNVQRRSSKIMIPGKSTCSPGWTVEYWGYLMAGCYNHAAASDYYCVDEDPEAISETKADKNGYLLYYVEGRCGSLPCEPYVENRELTCVVCTK